MSLISVLEEDKSFQATHTHTPSLSRGAAQGYNMVYAFWHRQAHRRDIVHSHCIINHVGTGLLFFFFLRILPPVDPPPPASDEAPFLFFFGASSGPPTPPEPAVALGPFLAFFALAWGRGVGTAAGPGTGPGTGAADCTPSALAADLLACRAFASALY